MLKINYMAIIGEKEHENKTINLRAHRNMIYGELNIHTVIKNLKEERDKKSLVSCLKTQVVTQTKANSQKNQISQETQKAAHRSSNEIMRETQKGHTQDAQKNCTGVSKGSHTGYQK